MFKTSWDMLDKMKPKIYVSLEDVILMLKNSGVNVGSKTIAEHLETKIKALPIYLEQKPTTAPPTYGGD